MSINFGKESNLKKYICIQNGSVSIPAIIWGSQSQRLLILVHGNQSNKEDTVIKITAKTAVAKGYQALSLDLPKHGERTNVDYGLNPQNCVSDLRAVYEYAKSLAPEISLFGCSMGAYFSLLAYPALDIRQCLFLSPVVDMKRVIENMMSAFGVTEERLCAEKIIPLPIGHDLDWCYYSYIKENPIRRWDVPTSILYGSEDDITSWEDVSGFKEKFRPDVTVLPGGEHFFHTEEQLSMFEEWLEDKML